MDKIRYTVRFAGPTGCGLHKDKFFIDLSEDERELKELVSDHARASLERVGHPGAGFNLYSIFLNNEPIKC